MKEPLAQIRKKNKAKMFQAKSGELIPPFYLWIGLIVLAVFTLIPFIYLLISSISPTRDLLNGQLIPKNPTLSNFVALFSGHDASTFIDAMKNSFEVASITTIITLILGTFAAYALSRINFPFRKTTLFVILAMQLLPAVSIIVPLYVIMREGVTFSIPFTGLVLFQTPPLLDNIWSLIIAYTTFSLPFAIWILAGYFQSIPKALEEAAFTDGCSRIGTLFFVVIPLGLPGIAATAIFTFLNNWDEFMFANAFSQTSASQTLPVVIQMFVGKHSIDWGLMTAGGLIASLPPVIVSLFLYRYIVEGLSGGVKD